MTLLYLHILSMPAFYFAARWMCRRWPVEFGGWSVGHRRLCLLASLGGPWSLLGLGLLWFFAVATADNDDATW